MVEAVVWSVILDDLCTAQVEGYLSRRNNDNNGRILPGLLQAWAWFEAELDDPGQPTPA